jgi:hypothetical protein
MSALNQGFFFSYTTEEFDELCFEFGERIVSGGQLPVLNQPRYRA